MSLPANRTKWFVYGAVPLLATVLMAGMYFSRDLVAQRLVAPKLPPLPFHSWREFGLLENAQHLLLFASFVVLLAGVRRATERLQRAGFVLASAMVLFIFLEEVDYGVHWHRYAACDAPLEWFRPVPRSEWDVLAEKRAEGFQFTVHSRRLTSEFKAVNDSILLAAFVLFPLVAPRFQNRYVRYLAPDRHAILTVLVMLATSEAVHRAGHVAKRLFREAVAAGVEPVWELGSLVHNLSEFREFIVYYLYAVYFVTLVFHRRLEPAQDAR